MNHSFLQGSPASGALFVLGTFLLTPAFVRAGSAHAKATASYSGRAIAVRIDGVDYPVVGPIIIGDTGPLPAAGGALAVSDADIDIASGALTIDSVDAEATGSGREASASARLSNYHVEVLMTDTNINIDADYIAADVAATAN